MGILRIILVLACVPLLAAANEVPDKWRLCKSSDDCVIGTTVCAAMAVNRSYLKEFEKWHSLHIQAMKCFAVNPEPGMKFVARCLKDSANETGGCVVGQEKK